MKQTTSNACPEQTPPEIIEQIGALTRQLHETLERLGVLPSLQHATEGLPDARSRLNYIAEKTSNAANTVLNLVDAAKEEQQAVAAEARAIVQSVTEDPVRAVASGALMNFVDDVEKRTARVDCCLTVIMLAQDFHDLTGQVIAKVVGLAVELEASLNKLIAQAPARQQEADGRIIEDLDGPQVGRSVSPKVVSNQTEVDDLLASLGF